MPPPQEEGWSPLKRFQEGITFCPPAVTFVFTRSWYVTSRGNSSFLFKSQRSCSRRGRAVTFAPTSSRTEGPPAAPRRRAGAETRARASTAAGLPPAPGGPGTRPPELNATSPLFLPPHSRACSGQRRAPCLKEERDRHRPRAQGADRTRAVGVVHGCSGVGCAGSAKCLPLPARRRSPRQCLGADCSARLQPMGRVRGPVPATAPAAGPSRTPGQRSVTAAGHGGGEAAACPLGPSQDPCKCLLGRSGSTHPPGAYSRTVAHATAPGGKGGSSLGSCVGMAAAADICTSREAPGPYALCHCGTLYGQGGAKRVPPGARRLAGKLAGGGRKAGRKLFPLRLKQLESSCPFAAG